MLKWTNPSVLAFAGVSDPVRRIQEAARTMALEAAEKGWNGPPFDPFELANILNYRVLPSQDVPDARLIPEGTRFRIEYNPNHPLSRIRFSIAHELAHTLFTDCRAQARQRIRRESMQEDQWQLEMLCNMAAAELLMPAGDLAIEQTGRLTIDDLLDLREKFGVSMETILLRVVRLERRHCAAFVASCLEEEYRIDYAVETRGAEFELESGLALPSDTRLANCRALGYTAKGDETWVEGQPIHVEGVAVPAYPGQRRPRVAGIIYRKGDRGQGAPRITFVIGDATKPHGRGNKVIAHVVNDKATRWGGAGFAKAIRRCWPHAYNDFHDWAETNRRQLRLGRTHASRVEDSITIFSMIAQQGYGESPRPRIRYQHLRTCLHELREYASSHDASVHIPRIGCGEAGGNWDIVQDLILDCLSDHGVSVTVYDLKRQSRTIPTTAQRSFFGEP